MKMSPAVLPPVNSAGHTKNKKIVFDDEGEIIENPVPKAHNKKKKTKSSQSNNDNDATSLDTNGQEAVKKEENGEDEEEDYFAKRDRMKRKASNGALDDSQVKWYNVFPQYPSTMEVLEIKATEQMELFNLCKSSHEAEMPAYTKRNPSDVRWLQTALHKGTAKDRANAGALLVTTNPLGNLEALNTLIGFTKLSNRSSPEVITILLDLWKEILLPPQRKLIPLEARGADWKLVKKDTTLTKERQRRIYSYWYFEHQLKDYYFEFLKNLQEGMQKGQENNKNISIVSVSQLLAYAPEKEQMLLTMLVNKLGDPIGKIASKALHHLTEVAQAHPNMCSVIAVETEKLLFRNNISDRAQHFGLCYLASLASVARPEVCNKLVHICFALFKVLVQKGAVNSRTMQAILRCLQRAIVDAKPTDGNTEILSKEMQDTIYRLVHLADIRIAFQTLGLLLQLVSVKTEKSDRFYNALYKKILDMDVINVGSKTAAQMLHIVHRAVHIDTNIQRAKAFIKRLLQLAVYLPPNIAAGCLIVIHKLQRSRKELIAINGGDDTTSTGGRQSTAAIDEVLAKFDSDGEERYDDASDDEGTKTKSSAASDLPGAASATTTTSSWHHAKVSSSAINDSGSAGGRPIQEISPSKYDPYHRAPAYAGAEFATLNELLLLREHFHPTVQVFADSLLNNKRIDYYGDPLRDFGLPHFLERFAFKNPKKLDNNKAETPTVAHRRYTAQGARGMPVQLLTKTNCTEDEMFIFNFLQHKRKMAEINKAKKQKKTTATKDDGDNGEDGDDDADGLRPGEVNDDEFEEYLDGFFGKKAKAAADAEANDADEDEELDFLKELGGELKQEKKATGKKKSKARKDNDDDDDDDADVDADWGDDDDDDGDDSDEPEFAADDNLSDDEDGSIDLENDDGDDGSVSLGGDDDDDDDDEDFAGGSDNDEDDDMSGGSGSDDDDEPATKKARKKPSKPIDEKRFAKKLKHTSDMSSLFAAADDFAEMLEESGKGKGQGTANALFNKDKSSDKQMKWEAKRHSNAKTYTSKRSAAGGHRKLAGTGKMSAKKRKHY